MARSSGRSATVARTVARAAGLCAVVAAAIVLLWSPPVVRAAASATRAVPLTVGGAPAQGGLRSTVPLWTYTVVRSYPHDPDAFTQGLVFLDGVLYEGTGLEGRSSIRRVALESGTVLQRRDVAAPHFGEGIAVWKSTLFELTWQSGLAFSYDLRTFAPRQTFRYKGEGWGLTHDGAQLIMSDGSAQLRRLDPVTFVERSRVTVTAAGTPLKNLNELEFVKGEVFANVWQTDYIARINPTTGIVTGYIDLRGLLSARERAGVDVLNGIAYDAARDRLFVTGKLWPRLFEITLRRK